MAIKRRIMRHFKRQKTQLEETDQASEPDMAGMLHLSNWELKTQFNNYDKFRVSLVAQMVKSLPVIQETWVYPWVGKITWRRKWQPTLVFLPGQFHGQRSLVSYSPCSLKSWTRLSD